MTKNRFVTTRNAIQQRLLRDYDVLGTWEKVGQKWGLNRGLAFMIAKKNYEPKDPHLRHKLGLPALIPAPACRECGEVHVRRGCSKEANLHRDLFSMSVEELRWRFEQRETCDQMVKEDGQ